MNKIVKTVAVIIIIVMLSSTLCSFSFANNEDPTVEEAHPMGYKLDDYDYSHSIAYEEIPNSSSPTRNQLPLEVDLSESTYFPGITQQIAGSCAAFSTVYYQYNYEVNKYNGVAANSVSPYCPQFTYALVKTYINGPSSFEDNHNVLKYMGCLRYSDYPDNTIDTYNGFLTYVNNNIPAKYEALKTRAIPHSVEKDYTEYVPNGINQETNTFITFGTNQSTDHTFDDIKLLLAQGKIVTMSINFYGYFDTIEYEDEDDKYTMIYSNGDGAHAVAIVGYDDTIWYDLDGDEEVDACECGAFKVANSWGTTYGTRGYFWILYDAFNKVSQSNVPDGSQPNRGHLMNYTTHYLSQTNKTFSCFFYTLEIVKPTTYFVANANVSAEARSSLCFWCHRNYMDNPRIRYPSEEYANYSILSDGSGYTANSIIDLTSLCTPFANYYTGNTWCFKFRSYGNDTVNSVSITDNLGNTIAVVDVTNYQPSNTPSSIGVDIDLEIGDLNYDGTINSNDITFMRGIIASSVTPSSVQEFLADIDGSGYINVRDLALLKLLANGHSLTDSDLEDLILSDPEYISSMQ